MTDTITINGKVIEAVDITDEQKNMIREAMLARTVMEQHEYQYILLKTRHDNIVRTLEEELAGDDE